MNDTSENSSIATIDRTGSLGLVPAASELSGFFIEGSGDCYLKMLTRHSEAMSSALEELDSASGWEDTAAALKKVVAEARKATREAKAATNMGG